MNKIKTCIKGIILAISLSLASAPAIADEDIDSFFVDGIDYDRSIPTPEEALGFRLGEAPVRHHMLVDYITSVANASPRMRVEVIGYSHERRPILSVVVTSPANHARLDEIRAQHIALTEPASGAQVTDDMPVVTWLNYGVHGAEESGMDAALPTIHYLAAAQGAEIERLLDESIILITAVFNPDGHSRRAAWEDMYLAAATNADPATKLHNQEWPGGRTNHYWFDLNRQWLLQTQPESQAWLRKWHEWRPNITVDYHEMGPNSTYYFHPGIPSRTFPLVPQRIIDLMYDFAGDSEAFMDSEDHLFFHEESFDNFYIGKGSTYPLVNGGMGILYEAASGRGGALETPNGIRTYRENIRIHFRTSLASIRGAHRLRNELLSFQKTFFDTAMDEAAQDDTKAYIFSSSGDKARLYHFMDTISRHRIEIRQLARAIIVDGIEYQPGDAFIVPLNQPQYRFIKAVFERFSEFEDPTFYDVSAWTLPLAFNLDFAPLRGRQFQSAFLGDVVAPAMPTATVPDQAGYAYAFEWNSYYAPRALFRLLDQGARARVSTKPLTVQTTRGERALARGSIIVPLSKQPVDQAILYDIMEDIAAEDGIEVHAVTSGLTSDGPDLGAPSVRPLTKPEIVIAVGNGISAGDAGEAWHLLDYRMHMPVTHLDLGQMASRDLARYTHIVLPGGNYRNAPAALAGKLKDWVEAGGTIVAMRQGAKWAERNVLADAKNGNDDDDSAPGDEEQERANFADKSQRDAVEVIGGTIFGGDLDNTHPLGFGFAGRRIASHRNTTLVFERPKDPYATIVRYLDEPVLSGYASDKNKEKIGGTAMLIGQRKGRGSVVLFADDPNFRGIFYGTNRLFMNAIFFSTTF